MTHFDPERWNAYTGRKTEEESRAAWDQRAGSYARRSHMSSYHRKFLALMDADPSWTALDVGSGPGTISLPLARTIKQVTAIDLSPKMIEALRRQACDLGIANIDAKVCSWGDDWDEAGVPVADVAFASRSSAAPDLESCLSKLDAHARRRACLTTIHGDMPSHDRRLWEAVGRELPAPPDYIEVVDCLYDMGICCSVNFIPGERHMDFSSYDEGYQFVAGSFGDLSDSEAKRLQDFCREHLVFDRGSWTFDYKTTWSWAFLRWDKE